MSFLLEVLVGGLLAGVMYTMVALGFVLIYKASGVFNFAQGAMVLFAALTFVSLVERGLSFPWALAASVGGRCSSSPWRSSASSCGHSSTRRRWRSSSRRSDSRSSSRGSHRLLWGTQVHGLELGISDAPLDGLGCPGEPLRSLRRRDRGPSRGRLGVLFRTTRAGVGLARGRRRSARRASPWASICSASGRSRGAAPGVVALVAGLALGRARRRAVLALARRLEGAARAHHRRLLVDRRSHRRRADRRRVREARRGLRRLASSAAVSRPGFPTSWRSASCSWRPTGLFGERAVERV